VHQRAKRVTLRDVADEAGLSMAAVSYALRGLHVPVDTQQRVRDIADRLGYQVDPIARALASGRTGYVGLLCGSLTDIWQQGIAADIGLQRRRPGGGAGRSTRRSTRRRTDRAFR
jgi:LacI family transcriptional regulator